MICPWIFYFSNINQMLLVLIEQSFHVQFIKDLLYKIL